MSACRDFLRFIAWFIFIWYFVFGAVMFWVADIPLRTLFFMF